MRASALCLLLLSGVVVFSGVSLAAPDPAAEVQALLDRFVELHDRGDAAGLTALYAADALVLPQDGRAFRGPEQIRKFWSLEQARVPRRIQMIVSEKRVADGIGYLVGKYSRTKPPQSGHFTICVRRGDDGAWRIASHIWNEDMVMRYQPLAP